MVRLLLVLAPAVSILSGVGVSNMIRFFLDSANEYESPTKKERKKSGKKGKKGRDKTKTRTFVSFYVAFIGLMILIYLITIFICHATFAGAEVYSSPSIVL
jgi:dolichyl-diphosphooligosaccharide--protein glycosyltransferase